MYKVNLDKLICNINRRPDNLPSFAYDKLLFLRSVVHITVLLEWAAILINPPSATAKVTVFIYLFLTVSGKQTRGTVED